MFGICFRLFWSFIFVVGLAVAEVEVADLETLRLTQVIFRHGDRNPLRTYPTDPYWNETLYWPEGFGQLTDIGKMQEFNLGRYLRRRYETFISRTYVRGEMEILTSYYDRTIMSLESNLAGFYVPENGTRNWNPNIPWTPVPFRIIPMKEDNLMCMCKPCPRYKRLLMEYEKSDDYRQRMDPQTGLLETLIKESGVPQNLPIKDLMEVYDALRVQTIRNMTLPNWARTIYDNLTVLEGNSLARLTATPGLKRLQMGPLLKLLLENMNRTTISRNDSKLKMHMYSAHEVTIAGILDTLGVYNMIIPEYAAAVLIELHKDPQYDDFHVNLLYRNDTRGEPMELEILNCSIPCFLNTLIRITEPFVPGNWDEECKDLNGLTPPVPIGAALKFGVVQTVTMALVIVGCLIIICYLLQEKKESYRYATVYFRVSGHQNQKGRRLSYDAIQET